MNAAGGRPLIAFDLGGVLIDVRPLHLPGVPPSALQAAFFGHTHAGAPEHTQVATGHLDARAWLQRVAARLARPRAEIEAAWRARLTLADGAEAVFEAVADADTVVWSNTDAEHFAHLRRWLPGAMTAPGRRALSFELGALKPAGTFYAAALDRLERAPTLFVDDKAENVDAARALGFPAEMARGPAEALAHVRRALAGAV
jgi:HAD superfamily hydrolase (TIGR01509 family)